MQNDSVHRVPSVSKEIEENVSHIHTNIMYVQIRGTKNTNFINNIDTYLFTV